MIPIELDEAILVEMCKDLDALKLKNMKSIEVRLLANLTFQLLLD